MKFTDAGELGPANSVTQVRNGKSVFSVLHNESNLLISNKHENIQYLITPRPGYRIYSSNKTIVLEDKLCVIWSEYPTSNNYNANQAYLSVIEKGSSTVNTRALFSLEIGYLLNTINTIIHNGELLIFITGYNSTSKQYTNAIFSYNGSTTSTKTYSLPNNYYNLRFLNNGVYSVNGKLYIICMSESYNMLHLVVVDNEVSTFKVLYNNYSNSISFNKGIVFKNNLYVQYNAFTGSSTFFLLDKIDSDNTSQNILALNPSGSMSLEIESTEDYMFTLIRINNTGGGYTAGFGYDFFDGNSFTGSVARIDSFAKIKNFTTDRSTYQILCFTKIKDEHYISMRVQSPNRFDIYKKTGDSLTRIVSKSFAGNNNPGCTYMGTINDELYFDLTYDLTTTTNPWTGLHYLAKFDGESLTELKIDKSYAYMSPEPVIIGKTFHVVYRQYFNSTNIYYSAKISLSQFKHLIHNNGEYKKWVEEKAATDGASVIPTMTSNLLPNGEASASVNGNVAYVALDKNSGTAWSIGTNPLPAWWQYMFPEAKTIAKYKLSPNGTFTPQAWTFLGSNDNSNWTIIDTQVGQTVWNGTNQYNVSNTVSYKYYRFNFTIMNSTNLGFIELEMLEQGEPAIPAHWQTISTSTPSIDTFKTDGMEDLSVLDRKPTAFVNPMSVTGTIGSGKVFKKNVDLKKLFEIQSLIVK